MVIAVTVGLNRRWHRIFHRRIAQAMMDRMWEEAGRSRPSSAPSLRCILAAASDGRGMTHTCTMIVWRRRINIYKFPPCP
jgi:hypothetical protein